MSDPVLEVKNLNAYYYGSGVLGRKQKKQVLFDVNFEVRYSALSENPAAASQRLQRPYSVCIRITTGRSSTIQIARRWCFRTPKVR